MKKIKIVLRELLLIPFSAIVGGVIGLFLGMIYGGNYGSVLGGIFGPGYEGAGLLGLLLGATALVAIRVYFWSNNLKISSFAITLILFLVSSVIAYYLFYLELTYLPGKAVVKAVSLATILVLPLLGLLIPTLISRKKIKGRK